MDPDKRLSVFEADLNRRQKAVEKANNKANMQQKITLLASSAGVVGNLLKKSIKKEDISLKQDINRPVIQTGFRCAQIECERYLRKHVKSGGFARKLGLKKKAGILLGFDAVKK